MGAGRKPSSQGSAIVEAGVGLIRVPERLRAVDPAQVKALAESIMEVGLLNPITVSPGEVYHSGQELDGFEVIAEAHRFEACKSRGLDEIPTVVVSLSDDHRVIAECDDNLMPAELSPADPAILTKARKEACERKHPEARHGTNQHTRVRQLAEPCPARFTADTAKCTGQSERFVRCDAKRGSSTPDQGH